MCGEAHLEGVILKVYHAIFRLEVSVSHFACMQMRHCIQQLPEVIDCNFFWYLPVTGFDIL